MKVAIVKYNAGNNFSVVCALRRIGIEAEVTDDAATLRNADRVIFPGVGEANAAMSYLHEHNLVSVIKSLYKPVLGICIGQQLLCAHSEEGDVDCIGIFNVPVKKFHADGSGLKIPHMGWNTLDDTRGSFIPAEMKSQYVYYVHSYYVPLCGDTDAVTNYIEPFSAALHKDNFYATQFHPEKSGDIGEAILKRFVEI